MTKVRCLCAPFLDLESWRERLCCACTEVNAAVTAVGLGPAYAALDSKGTKLQNLMDQMGTRPLLCVHACCGWCYDVGVCAVLCAEDELEEALDLDSERLAPVLTNGEVGGDRPIVDAAVLQPLAAAAHLSLNSVTTKAELKHKDKSDGTKFPPTFVTWGDDKLTTGAAAAAPGDCAASVLRCLMTAPINELRLAWR